MSRGAKLLSLGTIVFIAIVLISSKFIKSDKNHFVSPFPFKFVSHKDLKGVVDETIKDSDINLGIYIKNLKTNESYKLNEDKVFEAGSLYKLWVMAMIFNKVNAGKISLDDNLEADIKDINDKFNIDEEDAELKEGHLQFTISSALEQMITISHNYAALLLLTKTSNSEVNSYIKSLGLKNSDINMPLKTTAADTVTILEKIYKGEVVSSEYSKQMLEILKRQKINDRLPKYLPPNTVIAHKTADINFSEHDGGIVYTPKGDYIIVVMTEFENPPESAEMIAKISKAVFDYFNKP